jgi:hypothetical protein
MTGIDQDRPCPHENFKIGANVIRLGDGDHGRPDVIIGYTTEISVWCSDCEERFRWVGVEAGLSQTKPMCGVDETELRAPIRPASSDPDFGMGIPGFAIRQVVGE